MNILRIGMIVLLLLCVFDMPYGYFQFLRIAAFVVFGLLAWEYRESEQKLFFALYLVGALLFNPVFPVHLGRALWLVMDLAYAALLGYDLVQLGKEAEDE